MARAIPHDYSVSDWTVENVFRDYLFINPRIKDNSYFMHLYRNFREAEDSDERVPAANQAMMRMPVNYESAKSKQKAAAARIHPDHSPLTIRDSWRMMNHRKVPVFVWL